MATFTKCQPFVKKLAEGAHDLGSDTLQIALCNAANPPVVANGLLADLTQIVYTNLSTQVVITSSSLQTAGVYKLICADLVLTASGAVAPFRYVVLFNQTAGSDELIGFYDYGSEVTLNNGDTFTIDFDAANGVLTIT